MKLINKMKNKISNMWEGENSSLRKTYEKAVANHPIGRDELIEKLVRDFTRIPPMSENEVREILNELIR